MLRRGRTARERGGGADRAGAVSGPERWRAGSALGGGCAEAGVLLLPVSILLLSWALRLVELRPKPLSREALGDLSAPDASAPEPGQRK